MIESAEPAFPTRRVRLAIWSILAAIGLLRVVFVFTENVNWDEFALFQRAEILANTGILQGGGRPGLVNLVLLPVAATCADTVQALTQLRLGWTLMVFGSVALFALLLRAALPPSPYRWIAIATAVGLWVLSPDFLRYSVHVRTDQPAIFFGLLGGLALAVRPAAFRWALAAGAFFALGFLASQKLVYVAALATLLAVAARTHDPEVHWRREMMRAGTVALSFVGLVLVYRFASASTGVGDPSLAPVAGIRRVFAYYRETIGFTHYRSLAFRNVHVLLALGVAAGFSAWRLRRGLRGQALPALAIGAVTLGLLVVWVHAARFPYFFLVLGLFPATAVGLALGPLLEELGSSASRKAVLLLPIWIPMVGFGAYATADIALGDGQAPQREAIRFVSENFSPDDRGFDPFGEFGCRGESDPFPARFYQSVWFTFVVADGSAEVERMIREFRDRPVVFMLEPPAHHPYPFELTHFWDTRYVRYSGYVRIPGREIRSGPGWVDTFEVIVPGRYRWHPADGRSDRLVVNGIELAPGEGVDLAERGFASIGLPEGGIGMFALEVRDPPTPRGEPFFRPY